MQKKIMLALIMSSSIGLAQEAPVAAEAAPTQAIPETAQTSVAEVSQPAATVAPDAQMAEAAARAAAETTSPTSIPTEPVVAQPIETAAVAQPTPVEQPQPAPVPMQPAPISPEQPEQDEIEIKGIDTVDINEPKGNWLYKRIWWEKAERTYEKIKQLTDKILESRISFFLKRSEMDRAMFEFYADVGFRQGELADIIGYLGQQLEKERKEEGSLNEKERELLETLNQEKKNVEQLQQGIQTIGKVDDAIEVALQKLIDQLHQAKYYEQQSWEIFKAINRELSDKKARELFYTMDTYWRNLNSINSYLSDAFSKYFEQLTQKLNQESDKIKTTIQGLSEKGINLQTQALAMKRECKLPAKEAPELPEQSSGLLGTVWNLIKAPFAFVGSAVGGTFNWIASWFGGGSSEDTVVAAPARSREKAPSATPEETIE